MLETGQGNLLTSQAEALVNAVNTCGVMGGGIALAFRNTFPDMFQAYKKACMRREVVPGKMHIFQLKTKQYIINFPTKDDPMYPSELEFISSGLIDLVKQIKVLRIQSVAIPALGCGLGGLSWANVRPLIVHAAAELPDVRVVLYEPQDM